MGYKHVSLRIALLMALILQLPITVAATVSDSQMAATYGNAWSPKLGAWLPTYGDGFDPWDDGQTAISNEDDFFVCSATPVAIPTGIHSFYFAGIGCPALKAATFFVYGEAGPPKGHILYDRTHRLVLFSEGCCSWGHVVLAETVSPPPKPVTGADLSAVRTKRGVRLGMSPSEVIAIYGHATLHAAPKTPNATMLSYTTLKLKRSDPGNKCGQFQNFVFRAGRLVYIELLGGC